MTEDQLNNSNELGELLNKAREKLSLSQKDIASRLNLKEEIISALDTNDFDKLPAPTYVRGYIRSYARTVNLNADSLINIYEGIAEAPPEILPDVKPVVQASSRDTPVKVVTYLLTFTVAILFIAWWQGQHIVSTDFFSSEVKTSEGGEYPGGFTYAYNIVNHPETPYVSAVDELDDREPNNMEIIDLAKSSELKLDNILSIEDSLNPPTQTNLDSSANSDTLNMELTAESWIEVSDVSGKKLYMDLAKPGEKISIIGTAPFSVKLGNARAVTVSFNGKAFDTSKHSIAGVARFSLE